MRLLLVPGVRAERRRRVIGAIVAGLAVVVLLVFWQPWRATPRSTALQSGEQPALPLVGGHLWAAERRDAYGTLASSVSDLVPPKVRWILPDASGFSGGPAVDAGGNIYLTSNAGTLYALTPAGEMLWQVGLPAEPVGALALGLPSPARPQDGATLYVTDKAGGLAAFTPGGELLWRFRTQTGRRASSGPVVGADGTVYYTVVDRVEAVTPEGKSVWTSQRLPGHGETAPRLDPAGNWLYVQDVVVKMADGGLADLSAVAPPGRAGVDAVYMIGGDGRNYLRESHAVFPWRPTASGGERVGQLTWNYQGSVIYLPMDSGVTRQGIVWLRYGSQWDDLRLVLLSKDGGLLTNAHTPQRSSQVIAADGASRIYICGANRTSNSECVAFAAGSDEPIWQVLLPEGGQANGGALVPGRLYVTTSDGFLYAIGDE